MANQVEKYLPYIRPVRTRTPSDALAGVQIGQAIISGEDVWHDELDAVAFDLLLQGTEFDPVARPLLAGIYKPTTTVIVVNGTFYDASVDYSALTERVTRTGTWRGACMSNHADEYYWVSATLVYRNDGVILHAVVGGNGQALAEVDGASNLIVVSGNNIYVATKATGGTVRTITNTIGGTIKGIYADDIRQLIYCVGNSELYVLSWTGTTLSTTTMLGDCTSVTEHEGVISVCDDTNNMMRHYDRITLLLLVSYPMSQTITHENMKVPTVAKLPTLPDEAGSPFPYKIVADIQEAP